VANIPKLMTIVQLSTLDFMAYKAPVGVTAIVKNIMLTNTTTADVKVTINFVANGASSSAQNRIVSEYTVTPSNTVVLDLSVVLRPEDAIHATANVGSSVNMYMSGVEVS
jgi:hypothetical protein